MTSRMLAGRNFLEATACTLFENYLLALRILCIFKFFLVSPSLNKVKKHIVCCLKITNRRGGEP